MWYEIDGFWSNKVEEKLQKYWYIESQTKSTRIYSSHLKKNKTKLTTNPQNPASLDKALF